MRDGWVWGVWVCVCGWGGGDGDGGIGRGLGGGGRVVVTVPDRSVYGKPLFSKLAKLRWTRDYTENNLGSGWLGSLFIFVGKLLIFI